MAIGSKVGFGMNLLIFPPTSSRFLPFTSAHCMHRFCHRRVDVAGERVLGLVVVVVGVERTEPQVVHGAIVLLGLRF